MFRKFIWMLVLLFFLFSMIPPAQAAELVNPITLYQEAVKTENMIQHGEPAANVLEQLDLLSDMYTRLDLRNISQRIEGMQAVSSELIGLKHLFAAVKGPDPAVAQYRIQRIVVAFDSLAYPNSPAWLPVARSMENQLEKLIELVAKQDQKSAKQMFAKLRNDRDRIWLALQLHGSPSELNLQQSSFRYLEGQFAGDQVTDKQGMLDALGQYKSSLGQMTAGIQVVQEPPLLPVLHVTLSPGMYGMAVGVLLLWLAWKAYRNKKN